MPHTRSRIIQRAKVLHFSESTKYFLIKNKKFSYFSG